jgi:hypothetical protein
MSLVAVRWTARPAPLPACAAWARGDAARRLAHRLLREDPQRLATLAGVAGDGLLLVLATETGLPWVDGIGYLGRCAEAPALLLPTQLSPSVPAALLERAILAQRHKAPVAVLPGLTLVATDKARPIVPERLRTWLEHGASWPHDP